MTGEALMDALPRGGISATAVAALLWPALDRCAAFAGEAALGTVLAGAACAMFALVYGLASLAHGRLASLALASALSLPPLLLLAAPPLHLLAALGLVAAICVVCVAALPRVACRSVAVPGRGAAWRAGLVTAAVSGAVSAQASLLAPQVAPAVPGALTSPPLLAAAVAWELHRQDCRARVLDFLRGYTAGLAGRRAFVALFGALLAPAGLLPALSLALVLAWGTGLWMKWWSRVARAKALNV